VSVLRSAARRWRLVLAVAATAAAVIGAMAVARRDAERDAAPAGGWAFVPSVPGDRAVVWAVGDGADGGDDGRAVAARIARGPVSRLLYLGDVYDHGTAAEFADEYATTYGRLARVTAPVSGNHDARNETTGYDPYWRRVHGVRPPDWYSFRAGGWTFLALDSEAPHHRGSAQERWLRRQVRAPGTCRVAFWHRPRYSDSSRHGDQPDMAPLVQPLRRRAAIVVAGHDHDMQRLRPVDGITHFVSGAGGRSLYPLRRDRRLAFGDDRHYGALRLDLRPGVARHAFVTADGRTLDSGTIRCRTRS
jgi:predicted phosphodiesterase